MDPEYLLPLFSRSATPCDLRNDNKLIQPLKRTATHGIKSLALFTRRTLGICYLYM